MDHIRDLLVQLEDANLQFEVLAGYHQIKLLKKSAYYWYNATFIRNISNIPEVVAKIKETDHNNSIYVILNYVSANLEFFLKLIKTKFTYIYNPLYILETDIEKPIYFTSQTRPSLTSSYAIKNKNISPFIRDFFLDFMIRTFKMDAHKIYIANKFELYMKQKSVLGTAFISDGFKPNFNNPVRGNVASIEDKIGIFINSISTKINYSILVQVKNIYTANFTPSSKLIHHFLDMYLSFEFDSMKDQMKHLHETELKIQEITTAFFPRDEHEAEEPLSLLPPTDSNIVPKNEQVCEFKTSSNTVFTVLSRYPSLLHKKTHLNTFIGICPIQIKHIVLTFPYYKNYKMKVVDNFIVAEQDAVTRATTDLTNYTNFLNLKNFVKFNGDYKTFKSLIAMFEFTNDDLEEIENIYYNMNGYRCAIIASALLNFHFNYFINDKNIYTMFSKLSAAQQQELDNNLPCKVPKKATDILLRLSESMTLIPQSFNHIRESCVNILAQNTFQGQVAVASKTNHHVISLIQFAGLSTTTDNFKAVLPLLYLFSSAPLKMKQLIYRRLPKYSRDNTFDTNLPGVAGTMIAALPSNANDVHEELIIGENNFNVVPDYMQYIKIEKDFKVYSRLCKLFNESNKGLFTRISIKD